MKRSLHLFLLLVALCSAVAACGNSSSSSATSTPSSIKLNIFAAASLTESFTQIATAYHQLHPDVTITNNFNGSQLLEQQIANGAPRKRVGIGCVTGLGLLRLRQAHLVEQDLLQLLGRAEIE